MASLYTSPAGSLAGINPGATLVHGAGSLGTRVASWLIGLPAGGIALLMSRQIRNTLLAIALLNIPLQVEKHFFIREDARDFGSVGGLRISLTTIALAGLYLGWLLAIALKRWSPALPRRTAARITLPAALFVLFCAISLLVAEDPKLGCFALWSTLEYFLLYLYVANCVTSEEGLRFNLRLLFAGMIFESLLMLAQAAGIVGDIDFLGFKARADFAGDHRISGTLGSPNPAAAYLAMMMTLASAVLLGRQKAADKWLAGISAGVGTLPLIFTQSRGGWLALLVGFAMIFAFGGSGVPRRRIAMVGFVVFLLALPLAPAIAGRLFGDDNGSSEARMPLNRLATVMIADHPLLGVGTNNFPVAMQPYLGHNFSGEFLYSVHNTYLLVLAETGIGGLFAFLWYMLAVVRQGTKCSRSPVGSFAMPALACAAAVVGLMVQMNFDPFRTGAANQLLWLFGGLVSVMNRLGANCLPAKH